MRKLKTSKRDVTPIQIRRDLHKRIKELAVKKDMYLEDLVESILFTYLSQEKKSEKSADSYLLVRNHDGSTEIDGYKKGSTNEWTDKYLQAIRRGIPALIISRDEAKKIANLLTK